jgi:hypothetical protein
MMHLLRTILLIADCKICKLSDLSTNCQLNECSPIWRPYFLSEFSICILRIISICPSFEDTLKPYIYNKNIMSSIEKLYDHILLIDYKTFGIAGSWTN